MTEPTPGPMNDLLERATRDLPTVDLVDAALRGAGRTRARRRAAVAGAAVVAVAAAVGIAVAVQPGPSRTIPTQQIPAPKVFQAPALPADIIEPPLDLGEALQTPAGDGLPTSLTPHDAVDTPLDRALMVTKERRGDQHVFYALDTSMRWHKLYVDAPADIGNGLGPMLDADALSPDGTKVALRGAKYTYVYDLPTGQLMSRHSLGGSTAHWTGDHTLTIVKDFRTQQTSDGDTVITLGDRGFTETRNGSLAVRARLRAADSYGATGPVATPGRLAVYADPMFAGRKRAPGPGMLVLDRPAYRGVAFLPLRRDATARCETPFSMQTEVPRGWLDAHTLLFSDAADSCHSHPPEAAVVHYFLWNIDTSTVTHVASVDQYWRDSSWASQLLRR